MSFWKGRQMGWGLSVSVAHCAQASSAAQTALAIQSGAKNAAYPATGLCPSTGFRNGLDNAFQSPPFLIKASSYTWDTMANPAQHTGSHGKMCPLLEKKRQHRRYMKMDPGTWVARILWSLLTAMAFSCIQWCACTGSSPHHIQLFQHGLFSESLVCPQTAFTFDVLDHFYINAMECKTAGFSFFQKLKRFTNNSAPGSVPVSV